MVEDAVRDGPGQAQFAGSRVWTERCALRAAAQVEGYLEELLLLCQRSEEYNQFMLGKMQEAVAPKTLGASRENAFRCHQAVCIHML